MKRRYTAFAAKTLSALLALLFVAQVVPMQVYALPTYYGVRRGIELPRQQPVAYSPEFTYARTPNLRMPETADLEPPAPDDAIGEPVSVDEYTTTYQTGENRFTTVVGLLPNTFENEAGEQQPIDNTLSLVDTAEGQTFRNRANDMLMQVPVEIDIEEEQGVTVALDAGAVKLIPLDGDYSQPAVASNAVRYNNVYDGVDIQFAAEPLNIQANIILYKEVEQNEFRYKIDAPGLHASVDDGVIVLHNDSGEQVFSIAGASMYDATDAHLFGMSIRLEQEDGEYIAVISGDSDWLHAPERAYPVVLRTDVINTEKVNTASLHAFGHSFYYQSRGYAVSGWATKFWCGYTDGTQNQYSNIRTVLQFNGLQNLVPDDGEIEKATLNLFQYEDHSDGTATHDIYRMLQSITFDDIDAHGDSHWYFAIGRNKDFLGSFAAKGNAYRTVDITDTVNDWVKGKPNHGLMLMSRDENANMPGGLFFPSPDSRNDIMPYISIDWYILGDVPRDYPLDNITVNMRPISRSTVNGEMYFYGTFWDGVATPNAMVSYSLNDSSTGYNGTTPAEVWYAYPNSSLFEAATPGGTQYSRRISNWQTMIPFFGYEYNTLYNLSAHATQNGTRGASATSESYVVYQVQQFDTLTSIANYYGVPYDQIAFDNRIVDRLLMQGNQIFIRNPTRNATVPYNPPPLTEDGKMEIDALLNGRGQHCEFGYEPINLNTGNYYMNAVDATGVDFGADISIERNYNSRQAGYNSYFGRGWSFGYEEGLSLLKDDTIVYSRGDGSALPFVPDGNGGYTGPAGYYYELEKIKVDTIKVDFTDPDDEGIEDKRQFDIHNYIITNEDGSSRTFDAFGILTAITDFYGFTTTLEYDDDYLLSAITAPSGARYEITTSGEGKITAISLPGGGRLAYAYTGDNLTSFTDQTGATTSYAYDANNFMTSWTDANGITIIQNEYDSTGRVVKQVDGEGGAVHFAYAANQTTVTDPLGGATTYHYDADFRTTGIDYPDGTGERKEYNAANQLVSETNALGHTTTYRYDDAGNLLQQTRFDGKSQLYTYNANNQQTSFTDFDGSVTKYGYNTKNDLVLVTHPDGSQERYQYDANHNVTAYIDAAGNKTEYEYTGANKTAEIDPLGNRTEYFYNDLGQLITVVDALGNTTRTIYDAAGRVVREQYPDGSTQEYTYDAGGRCTSIKDPNGNVFDFVYDNADNLVQTIDPLGNVFENSYDAMGNETGVANPDGGKENQMYDAQSRLVATVYADGSRTTYEYDALGNVVKESSPTGEETLYEYDYRFGLPSKVTEPDGLTVEYQYDDVGRKISESFSDGTSITNQYDSRGRITSTTGRDGITTSYTYDALGRVVESTTSTGVTEKTEYNVLGQKVKEVDTYGAVTQYEYDALGRLLMQTDALDNATEYRYDSMGRQIEVIDALGYAQTSEYDYNGNLVRKIDVLGAVTEYTYDPLDCLVLIQDPLGAQTLYTYDTAGNLLKESDAYGNATTYTYNARGLMTSITEPGGATTTFAYNTDGQIIQQTNPLGGVTLYEYDAQGRETKQTEPSGLVTTNEYDENGNLVRTSNSAGAETTYTYDAAGRQLTSIDTFGAVSENVYDAAVNLVQSITPAGAVTQYEYDPAGRLLSVTSPTGIVTGYEYDLLGQTIKRTEDGQVWQTVYDELGRAVEETNPLGDTTTREFDAVGRAISQTDANGNITEYEYDAAGRNISTTDANGNTIYTEYDLLGRAILRTDALGAQTELAYNAAGLLLMQKDAEGYVTEYKYNALGGVVEEINPNGGATLYSYNAAGQMVAMTNPLGFKYRMNYDDAGNLTHTYQIGQDGIKYQYDELGREVLVEYDNGTSTSYEYDMYGNLAAETDNIGRTTRYEYNELGQLVRETNPAGGVTSYTYTACGDIETITTPGGATTTYVYDELDRLIEEQDALGGSICYTYDAVGNVITETDKAGGAYNYTYDAVGNLLTETNPLGQTATNEYDAAYNLVKTTGVAGQEITYEYNMLGNPVAMADPAGVTTAMEYDGNGNTIAYTDADGQVTEYAYDLLDNITYVKDPAGRYARYEYDPAGNLLSMVDASGNKTTFNYKEGNTLTGYTNGAGERQFYEYDEANRLVRVKQADGSEITYIYDALDQLVQKQSDYHTTARYAYSPDGELLAMESAAGEYQYRYDALGRQTHASSADGAWITYTYDALDNITEIHYPVYGNVSYAYDALSRLTTVTDFNGGITAYTYDANGNETSVTRPDGTKTTTEYNVLGNPLVVENLAANGAVLSSFAYTYNEKGFVTAETALQDGITTQKEYTYNTGDELVQVVATTGSETTTTQYEYSVAGNLTKKTETTPAGSVTTTYTYDNANRPVASKSSNGERAEYQYDDKGNMVRSIAGGVHTHYNYDADNNLTAVRVGSQPVMTAMYDAAGDKVYQLNRTTSPWQYQEPDTYVYGRELETTIEPGYWARMDAQAVEAAEEEQTAPSSPEPYAGEPQTQTIPHSETIAGQQTSSMFAYGFGLGLLQLFGWYNGALSGYTSAQLRDSWPQTVTTGESINTWDEEIPFDMAIPEVAYEPEVVAALEEQGYEEKDIRYLWVSGITNEEAHTYLANTIPGDIVSGTDIVYDITYYTNLPSEHTQILYGQGLKGVYKDAYVYGTNRVTSYTPYNGDSIYLYDGMGNVAQQVNGGKVTQSLTYDAYGNVQQGDTGLEPYFGYNAEQYIPEAGVQYLRARHYMPGIQSFTSQDTYLGEMDEPATHNLYSYVQNNPVNFADPSGHLSAAKITDKLETARKAAQDNAKGKATATSNTRTTTTTANAKATTTATKTKATAAATAGTKTTSSGNTIKNSISGGVKNIADKISSNTNTSSAASTAQQTPVYGGGKSLKEVAKDKNNHGVVMPTRADAIKAAAEAGKRKFCGPTKNTRDTSLNNSPSQNILLLSAGSQAIPQPQTGDMILDFIITLLLIFGLGWLIDEVMKLDGNAAQDLYAKWWEAFFDLFRGGGVKQGAQSTLQADVERAIALQELQRQRALEAKLTNEALILRDAMVSMALTWPSKKRDDATTIIGGFDKRLEFVDWAIKFSSEWWGVKICAEDLLVNKLRARGSRVEDIMMTPAIRPRYILKGMNPIIPVCVRCQANYGRDAFIPGTPFAPI